MFLCVMYEEKVDDTDSAFNVIMLCTWQTCYQKMKDKKRKESSSLHKDIGDLSVYLQLHTPFLQITISNACVFR